MKLVIKRKGMLNFFRNEENLFALAIACYYLRIAINDVNYYGFNGNSVFLSLIVNILAGLLFVCIIPLFKTTRRLKVLAFGEIIVGAIFLSSIFLGYEKEWIFMDTFKHVILFYIPLSAVAVSIKNRFYLGKYLYFCSLISLPMLIVALSTSYTRIGKTYNMEAGYIIMFPLLVVLSHYFEKHKWYDLVCVLAAAMLVLFIGSRGPLICLISFFVIYFLTSEKVGLRKKIVYGILILVFSFFVFIFRNSLIDILIGIADYYGFESRTLLLLSQNSITADSGRGALFEFYLERLAAHPFTGYGVMANWISAESYPHNIVIEFLYSFGYPIGIILLICVLYIMVKGISSDDKQEREINRIFVAMSTSLLLSNSFLRVWYFFVCIALCISSKKTVVKK